MKVQINIDKKFAFMILGAILILAGAIYGYAQTGGVVSHTWEEIVNVPGDLADGDDFEANTDTQDLSIDGNLLSLTDGGSVTLSSGNSPVSGSVVGGGSVGGYDCTPWGVATCTYSWSSVLNCGGGSTKRQSGGYDGLHTYYLCIKN